MTLAYNKSTSGHGTDGQTDRQSATQYAAPSYGGGPHNKVTVTYPASRSHADLFVYLGRSAAAHTHVSLRSVVKVVL